MSQETLHAFVEGIKREHRELGRLVQGVRDCMDGCLAEDSPQAWASRLHPLLDGLVSYLKQHFADEETGGYMEQALAVAPRFGHQADELARQHPKLLESFKQLAAQARSCNDMEGWQALHHKVTASLDELRSHEAAENGLL